MFGLQCWKRKKIKARKMSDIRSLPSECYAFEFLGLCEHHKLKSEDEIIREREHGTVPEAIFKHPDTQKIISVEVKRIVGNALPKEGKGRRLIRRRKSIIWPWTSTVQAALGKAHATLVKTYMVEEHYVVFVVPDNLSPRSFNRLRAHVMSAIDEFFAEQRNELKQNHVHVYMIQGPPELFDRF